MVDRRLLLILIVVSLALVVGVVAITDDGGSSVSLVELEQEGVVLLDDHDIYVVYNDGDPIALSSDAQHAGDHVEYCESSQMFESPAHGEKFDIQGFYFGGPARRGLDRYPVRVEGDTVHVNIDDLRTGPPRRAGPGQGPQGQFCHT